MTQYITIIDHLTGSEKPFTYLKNTGRNKVEAVARAMVAAFQFAPYFNVKVAKKVSGKKNKYLPILALYKDGSVDDCEKSNWNGWGVYYFTVTPDMLEN